MEGRWGKGRKERDRLGTNWHPMLKIFGKVCPATEKTSIETFLCHIFSLVVCCTYLPTHSIPPLPSPPLLSPSSLPSLLLPHCSWVLALCLQFGSCCGPARAMPGKWTQFCWTQSMSSLRWSVALAPPD